MFGSTLRTGCCLRIKNGISRVIEDQPLERTLFFPSVMDLLSCVQAARNSMIDSLSVHRPNWDLHGLFLASFYTALLYVSYKICKILFAFCFSPLNKVPGPWWARVTSLPLSLEAMKGGRAQMLHGLHRIYGPVIRIGPNEVSAGSYKDYRPIYNDAKSITKDPSFYSVATFVGKGNLFQMTNVAEHSSRRRMTAAPYSLQSITSLNVLIRERADKLVKSLIDRASESPSGTVDAFELCGLYSLEVICQTAFATDISAESRSSRGHKLLEAMDGSAKTFIFNALMPWLQSTGFGKILPGPIGECYRQAAHWELESRSMVDHLLQATAEGQSTENNFLAPLLDREDSFLGRKLTKDELIEEAMGIMFAGSGTTSTTLTYLLYALACEENAEIQTTLRQEVRKLPPDDMLALRACPYVNAVIKEVFRLFPTIISTLPRVLGGRTQLSGHVLPAGTVVGMQNYVHHRDPAVFDAPETFKPERWLNSTKEMELSLTPFSVGKRNCIGQNLAWEELYLAVDAVMRGDITLKLGKEMNSWEMDMEDRFNIAPKGRRLMLEIKKGISGETHR